MQIAFGKTEITPALPVRLSGFGKTRWANRIHDPLYARLFLFEEQGEETLLVQLDLIAADDFLKTLIQNQCAIAKDHLFIMATHTHSGPVGTLRNDTGLFSGLESIFGDLNSEYCQRIAKAIGQLTAELRQSLSPFEYRCMKTRVTGLGSDRHDPSLEADEDAFLLEFKRSDGRRALFLRMACHPTVLDQNNLEITADFPGTLEDFWPEYDLVAYVNGSCGDISTRFTRQGKDFNEAKRFGGIIYKALRPLLSSAQPFRSDFTLKVYQKDFILPVRKTDSPEEALLKLKKAEEALEKGRRDQLDEKALRLLQSVVEGARNNLYSVKHLSTLHDLTLSVGLIFLPDICLISVPVELFSKLSNPAKAKENVEFIGYTNGYFLYMPDSNAYRQQFYEAFSSPFEIGAGEKLIAEIMAWKASL